MLPGFRFLFAAIMLSMSLLIFALGAAALLRAAHESFASNSSWRAAPEVPFAQHPDTTWPVLATLRVEPGAMEKPNGQATVAVAPVQPELAAAEPVKNDRVAALRPAETPSTETAKPAELPPPMPAAENPLAAETASAASPLALSFASETATAADEHTIMTAAISETMSATSELAKSVSIGGEPAAAQAEPVAAPAANPTITTSEAPAASLATPVDSLSGARVATLGGPPIDVTDNSPPLEPRMVKIPRPRPDQDAIRKGVQARQAMHRQRLALRARLLLQQQQANPFGQLQPFPSPVAPH